MPPLLRKSSSRSLDRRVGGFLIATALFVAQFFLLCQLHLHPDVDDGVGSLRRSVLEQRNDSAVVTDDVAITLGEEPLWGSLTAASSKGADDGSFELEDDDPVVADGQGTSLVGSSANRDGSLESPADSTSMFVAGSMDASKATEASSFQGATSADADALNAKDEDAMITEPGASADVNQDTATGSTSAAPVQLFAADAVTFDAVVGSHINFVFESSSATGIVMCVTNDLVPIGASLVQELQRLGNHEPIQVFHCMADELSANAQSVLKESANGTSLQVIDVCSVLVDAGIWTFATALGFKSFWLKPVALLFSSFDHVILMDVDDIFLSDPARLRSLPAYSDTGSFFFYDRVLDFNQFLNTDYDGTSTFVRQFFAQFPLADFGLPAHAPSPLLAKSHLWNGNTAHEQDSSLVLVHKRRVGPTVLKLLWHLSTQTRHTNPIAFSWGDKEAFWISFELAGAPYSFSPWASSVVALPEDRALHPETLCGSLAQFWPEEGTSALLYVNGRDVISPRDPSADKFIGGINYDARHDRLLSNIPAYITPRHRREVTVADRQNLDQTCLIDMGAEPIDPLFNSTAPGAAPAASDTRADTQ
ncbi:hypothetical protein ACHHYP_00392 [Achlya hypogyna]|uniref:Uncharacterized protein n=1 Tax=Achlya hypogyna TaxID=1202772 RepID=A0A1V9ZB11_ACHHY|nr:hypothetical protein ACHHYP_00392 [Achlya hypogyna]